VTCLLVSLLRRRTRCRKVTVVSRKRADLVADVSACPSTLYDFFSLIDALIDLIAVASRLLVDGESAQFWRRCADSEHVLFCSSDSFATQLRQRLSTKLNCRDVIPSAFFVVNHEHKCFNIYFLFNWFQSVANKRIRKNINCIDNRPSSYIA